MGDEQAGIITGKMKKRLAIVLIAGAVGLVLMVIASMALGTTNYGLSEVFGSIKHAINKDPFDGVDRTLINLRLPRVLAVFAVGAGLSMAGVVFQAIIRNPLVDPYMTGVSSGAGFGATMYIAFFTGSSVLILSDFIMPIFAFVFAIIAFSLTFMISKVSGNNNVSFVLAGVIVAMGFSAVTTIMMMSNDKLTHGVLGFLYGSFSSISWRTSMIMVIAVIILSAIFIVRSRTFNVVLLGREQSMELGVNYDSFRLAMMILASFLTAICVAFVGIISFIGLIVPHIARMALGGDHRMVMPASMIVGALLLAAADLLVKEAMGLWSLAIPIGALTTLVGIPFFVYILKMRGKGYGQ